MYKKVVSGVMALSMVLGNASAINPTSANAEAYLNYAEALQKSLYFYECQQSGVLPEWNRVEWKNDSCTTDDVTGGWYDAGDHVKFNLPMAYSASMLAWGLYQYPEGVEKAGQTEEYINNLSFVLDYFVECDKGDEVVYQVGNGQIDHTWWGPVELLEYGMIDNGASYAEARAILSASEGCSAVFGSMSAALAAGYCALKDSVPDAEKYLEHAENIFKIADASKSDAVYNDSDASGFYRSSHFYDELFYASNWLYIATGDKAYLDKATSYIPYLDKELGNASQLKYTWGHCWDDTMQGAMLLYAQNTGDSQYINHVKMHLDYWTDSVEELDGGGKWLTTWGCLRYATTAGFIASVACDTILDGTDTSKYVDFYEAQANYCLGDNPDNRSYMVGYGENSPQNPHHRTAHGSWKNALETPTTNRHILYGALVGGPNQDGTYEDDRQNYINNEVACDYNAGFTGLLAKMSEEYGGTPIADFPATEVRDVEFFVEAKAKASDSGVDLSLKFTNHTAWPARVVDNMSFRYYMDLSEVISAGYSASDVVIRCDRDQSAMYSGEGVAPAVISPVTQYDGNIYYIEITYPDGRAAMPISEGRHQCETMLAVVYPNYGSGWNAENDYSNEGIIGVEDNVMTDKITVYQDGVLVYGVEPDGTVPETTVPVVTPTEPSSEAESSENVTTGSSDDETYLGDANVDGEVNVSDVVAVSACVSNSKKNPLSEQGLINGDVKGNNGLSADDAFAIQQYTTGILKDFNF